MMSHWLGIYLGITRYGISESRKAAACVYAEVVFKHGVDKHSVPALVSSHAVVYEEVVPHDKIFRGLTVIASLLGYARVVDIVEITVLDKYVFAVLPELYCVAEAYSELTVPDCASDEDERAASDCHIAASARQSVNTAAVEAEILAHGIRNVLRHTSLSPHRAFDMGIHPSRISLGVQQHLLFVR